MEANAAPRLTHTKYVAGATGPDAIAAPTAQVILAPAAPFPSALTQLGSAVLDVDFLFVFPLLNQ